MKRMFAASTIVVVVAIVTAFSPASGLASRGVPTSLVNAIHARLGAGAVRMSSAQNTAPPEAFFGYQVSLSADGTTALVGAPAVGDGTGAAYIFHVSSAGSWVSSSTPAATLTDGKGIWGDSFGEGVALSADGTTAFVGAPYSHYSGVIFVFRVPSENAWASSSTPTATLSVGHGIFVGGSLALSPDGTTLVVGAPLYDFFAGGAYVFHVASESAWVSSSVPAAVLSNVGESQLDGEIGASVAISGDGSTALLSDGIGGAYVYHVVSAAAWTTLSSPTAILSNKSLGGSIDLGYSLALSGDGTTAILGAPGVKQFAGAVDVFRASAEDNWVSSNTPTAILTNAAGKSDDLLGVAVAVSASGTTAVATGYGVGKETGAAYIYHVASEAGWASSSVPTAILTNSAGVSQDALGVGVTLSGDGATALVGAPGFSSFIGAADVFHASGESSWATSSTPNAILTDADLLNARCIVPNVKGLYLGQARSVLRAFGCRTGQVDNAYAKVKQGRVISEHPKAGTILPLGAKVSLTISLGAWHKP